MMAMKDRFVARHLASRTALQDGPRRRMAVAGPLVAALGVLWVAAWALAGGPKMSTAPSRATEIRGSF
jgi:hypothetical protein